MIYTIWKVSSGSGQVPGRTNYLQQGICPPFLKSSNSCRENVRLSNNFTISASIQCGFINHSIWQLKWVLVMVAPSDTLVLGQVCLGISKQYLQLLKFWGLQSLYSVYNLVFIWPASYPQLQCSFIYSRHLPTESCRNICVCSIEECWCKNDKYLEQCALNLIRITIRRISYVE